MVIVSVLALFVTIQHLVCYSDKCNLKNYLFLYFTGISILLYHILYVRIYLKLVDL